MRLAEKMQRGERVLAPAVAMLDGVGLVVLAGETRVRAMQLREEHDLQVYMIRTWDEFAAWLAVDLSLSRQHGGRPFDVVEAAYLYNKASDALHPRARAGAAADVAEYAGHGIRAVIDTRSVLRSAGDRTDPKRAECATAHLRRVRDGDMSPSGARFAIRRWAESRAIPVPSSRQAEAVREVAAMLHGAHVGLQALGDFDLSDISPEEAEVLAARISAGVRTIQRIKRQLKERAA